MSTPSIMLPVCGLDKILTDTRDADCYDELEFVARVLFRTGRLIIAFDATLLVVLWRAARYAKVEQLVGASLTATQQTALGDVRRLAIRLLTSSDAQLPFGYEDWGEFIEAVAEKCIDFGA